MVDHLYRDLAWLPRPPSDIGERFRALDASSSGFVRDLQALAGFGLDVNGLTRLSRAARKAAKAGHALSPLAPLKLGILGNGTLDLIGPALAGTAIRHGFALEVVTSEYDQVLQTAMSPASHLNAAKPDVVLVALDWRGLPIQATPGDEAAAAATVQRVVAYIEQVCGAITQNAGALCIIPTLAAPPESLFGSLDRRLPGTLRSLIDAINGELARRIAGTPNLLLDVAAIAETVGLGEWYNQQQWNMAKLPFAETYIPLYADHVCRLLGALRGKSRRVLVLDLDNTLWGGVIGDDGMSGILLAQGDATGEAHLSVQRYALDMRGRGVVLAVCSKNTDEVAREVFQRHPEMLLREQHVAVFQANWKDKASNIATIASELSLGIDSIVFVDDNPVERGLIRQALPQVAVPELGEDPADFTRIVAAAGYFDLISFSEEDRKRADFYDNNARRAEMLSQVGDLDSYLASLEMEITFAPFDETGRARIVQLINKSNQFNLTTRRYTALDVQTLENDPESFTLQVRLVDRFGDNGMISVIVCRPSAPHEWEIDTWLMSCRVLGRGVERMVLREIILAAREHGVTSLRGVYKPTERNALVEHHYAELGFELVNRQDDGQTVWRLSTDTEIVPAQMTVKRAVLADA